MSKDYTQRKAVNEPFTSYDLGLSATLVTLGFELSDMDKTNPRHVLFLFDENNEQLQLAVKAYLSDSLKIKARSYFDNLRAIKNRLYDAN